MDDWSFVYDSAAYRERVRECLDHHEDEFSLISGDTQFHLEWATYETVLVPLLDQLARVAPEPQASAARDLSQWMSEEGMHDDCAAKYTRNLPAHARSDGHAMCVENNYAWRFFLLGAGFFPRFVKQAEMNRARVSVLFHALMALMGFAVDDVNRASVVAVDCVRSD